VTNLTKHSKNVERFYNGRGTADHWSLTTLREKLVKTGAKVVRHAKYVTFQLTEVVVARRLFAAILDRIARLAILPPFAAGGHG